MTTPPPPRPRAKRRSPWFYGLLYAALYAAVILLVVGAIFATAYYIFPTGTRALDNEFGDQWLKTSVALLELHRVRYGKYPSSLDDLKFIGDWDRNALANVHYYPNQDHTAYYIEVERGWMGRPTLKLPDEFWRGTGYTESLKPGSR